jgi:hypothetical protein
MPNTFNMFLNVAAGEVYLSRMNGNGGKDVLTFVLKVDMPQTEPALPVASTIDLSGVYEGLNEIKTMLMGAVADGSNVDDASNTTDEKRSNPRASGTKSGTK